MARAWMFVAALFATLQCCTASSLAAGGHRLVRVDANGKVAPAAKAHALSPPPRQALGKLQLPKIAEWYDVANVVPAPRSKDWSDETMFLEGVMRSFGKQRTDYTGVQQSTGFKDGLYFDDKGMFNFDDSVKSVAIDVGAATNPLVFDLNADSSQVAFLIEPYNWKTLEHDVEHDANEVQTRGGCVGRWEDRCVFNRFYVFPAAVSEELGHTDFHVTGNPYCGSLDTFQESEVLKTHKDPEIRGVFDGCYKDQEVKKVPTLSLKSLLERIPQHIRVKYMKVDAQGHDYKVVMSAKEQLPRIEYMRFEMQVDPPKDRRLHKDIPSYAEVAKSLGKLGYKYMGRSACNYDQFSSNFSKAINEMECIFCKTLPCKESGVGPFGANPVDVAKKQHMQAVGHPHAAASFLQNVRGESVATLRQQSRDLDRQMQAVAASLEPGATRDFLQTLHLCAPCQHLERFGEAHDGGYVMCTDGFESGLTGAYSYGINGFDGWGMKVASEYHIPLHEFDCTNANQPEVCSGCKVDFNSECVLNFGGEPRPGFKTMTAQLQERGDLAASDRSLLLKIDVEGAEWQVFAEEPVETLKKFRGIVVEYHWISQTEKHPLFLQAVKKVEEAGFAPAHLHGNNFGPLDSFGEFKVPDVLEVTYVQKPANGCDANVPYHTSLDTPNNWMGSELDDAVLPDK